MLLKSGMAELHIKDFSALAASIDRSLYDTLKSEELLVMASKLLGFENQDCTDTELSYLANKVSFPILQSLALAKRSSSGPIPSTPIAYLPLVSLLRKHGSKQTKLELKERLGTLKVFDNVHILFDTWLCSRPLEIIFDLWNSVSETKNLKLIGPNSAELHQLTIEREADLASLGHYLKQNGVHLIESGGDFELTKILTASGLSCTFTQELPNSKVLEPDFAKSLRQFLELPSKLRENIFWSIKTSNIKSSKSLSLIHI